MLKTANFSIDKKFISYNVSEYDKFLPASLLCHAVAIAKAGYTQK